MILLLLLLLGVVTHCISTLQHKILPEIHFYFIETTFQLRLLHFPTMKMFRIAYFKKLQLLDLKKCYENNGLFLDLKI